MDMKNTLLAAERISERSLPVTFTSTDLPAPMSLLNMLGRVMIPIIPGISPSAERRTGKSSPTLFGSSATAPMNIDLPRAT